MRRKLVAQKILIASEGLVATVTDLVLFLSILPFSMAGAYTSIDVTRRFEDVQKLIGEDLNYRTIKNTIAKLVVAGLITKSPTRNSLEITITKLGRTRLTSVIPRYHEKRPWDDHLYLVSYDMPAKPKRKRDLLREYLRRIGAVLLQESLWLTPYNPRDIVHDFVRAQDIGGSIIVSKLGTDGAIGEEKLPDLIRRVYRLDALNERYTEFIEKYERKKNLTSVFGMSTDYFSILKDDPQLPFVLLPDDFLSEKAYLVYQSFLKNLA